MTKNVFFKGLFTVSACAILAACQTTGTPGASQGTYGDDTSSKIDTALKRAAHSAAATGERRQSVSYLEKIYKRNSDDPIAAANYAGALREGDYINRAAVVLAPFADDPNAPAITKTEYAAVQLALGNYESAEKYAQKAVLLNEQDGRAYHYLGIALDAQGSHKQAERAFRKGLDNWHGDPTSIMNNLALNLTSQEYLDEAIEILKKAQAVSPNKVEIERNIRIVTALQETKVGRAPRPRAKPMAPIMDPKLQAAAPESAPVELVEKEVAKEKITDVKVVVPPNN